MSDMNVTMGAVSFGTLNNALQPLFKVNSYGGGITFLSSTYTPATTSGTAAPQLVDLGTAGTAVDHVIADFGTVVASAKVPNAATMQSNPYVAAGHYVGIRENNVGTIPAVSMVGFSYFMGK